MRSARLRGFPAERAACRRASSASSSSGTGAAGAAGASPRRGSSGGLAAEDCRPLRRSCSSSIPARMSSRSSLRKSAMKINSFYQFSKRLRNGFDWKVFCKYGTILEAVCKKSDGFCTGLCLYIARAGRILQEKPATSDSSCPPQSQSESPGSGVRSMGTGWSMVMRSGATRQSMAIRRTPAASAAASARPKAGWVLQLGAKVCTPFI